MTASSAPLLSGEPVAASRRVRDILLFGGLFAAVIAGLAGLAAATGWRETMDQIARLSVGQIGLLLLLSLVNYGLRGIRWHVLTRRLGLGTTLTQDLRHYLGGFAMSVTPGRLGELIRTRWIWRETGWAIDRTAPLILMDRAGDLAATALLLAIGLALGTGGIRFGLPVVIVALAAAFVATRPRLLGAVADVAFQLTGRFARLFARLRRAARSLDVFSSPRVTLATLALGMVGWLAEGYAFHLLLVWMGADIGFWSAVAIFIFATLAGGLTGAPGGVGGAEAAMVALLALKGIPLEVSVPATAIIRVTTLWFAILIGLLAFPIAERVSLRGQAQP